MKSTTKIGDISVAYVTAILLDKGYNIAKPLSEGTRYDLIIDKGNGFKRVQIKTVYKVKSQQYHLLELQYDSRIHRQRIKYDTTDVDVVIGFVRETNDLYIVPLKMCDKRKLCIWVDRKKLTKGVSPSEKFKNNFSFL